MHVHNVLSDVEVLFIALLINDYKEEIKTTHNRCGDLHIIIKRACSIVSAVYWVSSCQDRGAGVESGMDTSLGDRDSLLLHGLMNSSLVFRIHFIELIDATDTVVGEHKGSRLNTEFTCFTVFTDTSSETGCRTCLSRSIDSARKETTDVLEELTLGCCRVSNDADVDVTTKLDRIRGLFADTAEKLKEKSLLDVIMAMNLRRNRASASAV